MSSPAAAVTQVTLSAEFRRARVGVKGPRAAQWLVAQGITLPMAPNTWLNSPINDARRPLLVARLGSAEFFLEDAAGSPLIGRLAESLRSRPPGAYPILREDSGFTLGGPAVHDVLTQVCNIDFAGMAAEGNPLIMTLMMGVSVLVVPQGNPDSRSYRIWCDPTFGEYLGDELTTIVRECGGTYRGFQNES
jgi:sarcosine oxidase subunit gamma